MNRGTPIFNSGDQYEDYIGRWSRLIARDFITWLDVPSGGSWLDVGCGTGALVTAILRATSPAFVVGIDSSSAFIDYARSRTDDARATFVVGDAESMPADFVGFDAVVAGLLLNFLKDPQAALAQMVRATKPHGMVAAFVWDYAGQMQLMRHFWDAAIEIDPGAVRFDEGNNETLCSPPALARLFSRLLEDVRVTEFVTPTVFDDFEQYWQPFLGGQGSAPSYLASLTSQQQERLKASVRRRLPFSKVGAIHLSARAWAVRGTRPL